MTTGRTKPAIWANYDESKCDKDGFCTVSGGTGFTAGLIYITRKMVASSPTMVVCYTISAYKELTWARMAKLTK